MKNNFKSLLFFLCINIHTQTHAALTPQDQAILNTMSLDERIGQLFMVAASASPNAPIKTSQYTENNIKTLIEQYHIGGIRPLLKPSKFTIINTSNEIES
jgi:hypothetical protein